MKARLVDYIARILGVTVYIDGDHYPNCQGRSPEELR